jgi:metallo-beta-lactamase class B
VRGDTNYRPKPFAPIKVDRVIRDGATIRLGDVTLTAHLTPGHTPGCTSWSTSVRIGNHAYPEIASDYRTTFRKLATMKADIVLPSHPDLAAVLEREARKRGRRDGRLHRSASAASAGGGL